MRKPHATTQPPWKVGEGWYPLLDALHDELKGLDPACFISDLLPAQDGSLEVRVYAPPDLLSYTRDLTSIFRAALVVA